MFTLDVSNSRVSETQITAVAKKLKPEIDVLLSAATAAYVNNYSCLNTIDDTKLLDHALTLAQQYKAIDLLIIIGIGGSNLGTQAVQEALLGKLYNYTSKPVILYADTVDAGATKQTLSVLEKVLKQKGKVLLNIISKSGSTTETAANAEVYIAMLKEYEKEWQHCIVITTDEGSPLHALGQKHKFSVLLLPKPVGGRYSVFSPVGTFPLAVLGVDVKQLLAGASSMRHACLEYTPKNPAVRQAATLFLNKKPITDAFIFSTDYEAVGKWRRQLVAESLGKAKSRKGKNVHRGITPTVSIGSVDLHSIAQLVLAGPQDKYTTFIELTTAPSVKVADSGFAALVPKLKGKEFSNIMNAIHKGTQNAYKKQKLSFTSIALERNAYSLGEYLAFEMLTTIFLSSLLDVNPFDQPAVELYKIETRKLL